MRAFRTGLLLVSMLAASTAGAQNTGSFVIDDFRYQLVDLDPNDGITPYLTFTINPALLGSLASVETFSGVAGGSINAYSAPVPAATPNAISLNVAYGSGAGSFSGALDASLRLEGSASAGLTPGGATSVLASTRAGFIPFVLSPMSAVTFEVDSLVRGHLDPVPAGGSSGVGGAHTHLRMLSELLTDPLRDSHRLNALPGQSVEQTDTLQLTLSNPLGREVTNELSIFGTASVTSQTSPVPEPSGWAMLLAGAGVLGTVARRRRRKLGS